MSDFPGTLRPGLLGRVFFSVHRYIGASIVTGNIAPSSTKDSESR